MKKFVLFLGFLLPVSLFAISSSLTGYWLQISDKTHQPHSIIHIVQKDKTIQGIIVKAYPENGQAPDKFCTKCEGARYNQPIIGLNIFSGLRQTGQNHWGKGMILDPKSGKIYRCHLTLSQDGKTLEVRGYIGFSLFGRTQVWTRYTHK